MIIQKIKNPVQRAKADQPKKRATPLPRGPSEGEELLLLHIMATNCPLPEREYRFDTIRRWRFDFAYVPEKVGMEVEGGSAGGPSRHTDRIGYENDCIKYNAAAMSGWLVLRFTTAMIKDGRAIATIEQVVQQREITHDRPSTRTSEAPPQSGKGNAPVSSVNKRKRTSG